MVRRIVIFASFYKMNTTEQSSDKSNRVQLMIEAAQQRFGLYGVEKTSMREIADDINLSKAALYYYFPDKESLYIAVIEKEQNEFIANINEKLVNIEEPQLFIREYVNIRLSYFRKLLNLSRIRSEAFSGLKPVFRETLSIFKEKEKEIIIHVFKKGISMGIFSISDPDKTAELFLELLKGLRVSVVKDKKSLFIEQDEYDRLLQNTIEFTDIFINGLKIK
jgi:AcrR family transcriptional regulator